MESSTKKAAAVLGGLSFLGALVGVVSAAGGKKSTKKTNFGRPVRRVKKGCGR